MAHRVRTERGTRDFETAEEAEEFGRLQYVRGGTPAYTIVRDDRIKPTSMLENEVVVAYNATRAARRRQRRKGGKK